MRWRYFIFAFISIVVFLFIWLFIPAPYPKQDVGDSIRISDNNYIRNIPSSWILKLMEGLDTNGLQDTLCRITESDLLDALADEKVRITFLINLYNAAIIEGLKSFDGNYDNLIDRTNFFSEPLICVANNKLSPNDIEHDLLRNGRIWWSFGWFKKLSKNSFEEKMACNLDARIHFALNCGAASCPPIKIYKSDSLEYQLKMSMTEYIYQNSKYDSAYNTIEVIELMNWFIKDFGGQHGLIKIMQEEKIIPHESNPRIKYTKYDWSLKQGI